MYKRGIGVTQDYGKAAKWLKNAAKQGHAKAQLSLAFMYGKGKGVAQNYVQSHKWLNLAATHGIKKAGEVRDRMVRDMTSEQIAEARLLASEWMEKHRDGVE